MTLACRPSFVLVARAFIVSIAILAAACGGDGGTSPNVAAAIARVSADSQTTVAGVAMAEPLVVLVTDRGGTPLANAQVTWSIVSGGGSVSDTTDTTDVDGHARTTYTPGTAAGAAQLVAQTGSLTGVAFHITLVAGPAAMVKKFGSDNPAALKGSKLTLSVKVADQFGNGIQGVTVTWTSSGGASSSATSTTDSGGVASTDYTLGNTAGSYSLTATVAGLEPATFTIEGI